MRGALVLLVACATPARAPVGSASAIPGAAHAPVEVAEPPDQVVEEVVEPAVVHGFGGIDLVKSTNFAMHTHGGPPAQLAAASINFEVRDHRAHVIEVRNLELLRRHCREDKWRDRTRIEITGHQLYDQHVTGLIASGRAAVTAPSRGPQGYRVQLQFAKLVEVYQACDVFGYAIDLVVDRVPLAVEIELSVTREEPFDE